MPSSSLRPGKREMFQACTTMITTSSAAHSSASVRPVRTGAGRREGDAAPLPPPEGDFGGAVGEVLGEPVGEPVVEEVSGSAGSVVVTSGCPLG
ncbi:hypothetical protein GCM10027160_13210 [Streptomyces calidiresistens]